MMRPTVVPAVLIVACSAPTSGGTDPVGSTETASGGSTDTQATGGAGTTPIPTGGADSTGGAATGGADPDASTGGSTSTTKKPCDFWNLVRVLDWARTDTASGCTGQTGMLLPGSGCEAGFPVSHVREIGLFTIEGHRYTFGQKIWGRFT